MTKDPKAEYEYSLKLAADKYAISETAFRKGREEKAIEIIKNLLNMDILSVSQIAATACVDKAYVLEIRNELANNGK